MFNTKSELDRHVKDIFNKLPSDIERDSKCYNIAKQYFKIKDYDSSLKYVNRYLNNVRNTAAAQKLLGECYEALKKPTNALAAYKTSLEIEGGQRDVVLKVCELLCNPDTPVVPSQASYWLDRLQGLFPKHPLVFKLRERLLHTNAQGNKDPQELESLYLSEMMARPEDLAVRIRFLDFLVETKRAKTAEEQTAQLLTNGVFADQLAWYDCVFRVHQAYIKDNKADQSTDFQLRKLLVLERRSYFSLQDCSTEKRTVADCATAVFNFDQGLYSVSSVKSSAQSLNSIIAHYRLQLSYHLAILKLKRAKTEPGEWQRAVRVANPLLLLATVDSALKDEKDSRFVARLQIQAAERVAVCSRVLTAQAVAKDTQITSEILESCGGKWRDRVYEKLFYNKEQQDATGTSCFINDPAFLNLPTALPTEHDLERYEIDAQSVFPDSLHYLTWLGLNQMTPTGLNPNFRCRVTGKLPLTVSNISNTGPETLNQLDVDAFLYCAVFCSRTHSKSAMSVGRLSVLPPSITEVLATQQQMEWWSSMYQTLNQRQPPPGSSADLHLRRRKGIETVRACGNHGLHPKLLVLLAKQFQLRAADTSDMTLKAALELRADEYWKAAIPLLERLEKNQVIRDISSKLFDIDARDFKSDAVNKALEEGKLFLGCQLMKQEKFEDALETFGSLKSPYATYYQGVIYKKMADHANGGLVSLDARSQLALLANARSVLRTTEDRLSRPGVAPNPRLMGLTRKLCDEVEVELARCADGEDSRRSPFNTFADDTTSLSTDAWLLREASPVTSRQTPTQVQSTPRSVRQQLFTPPNTTVTDGHISMAAEMNHLREDVGEVKTLIGGLLCAARLTPASPAPCVAHTPPVASDAQASMRAEVNQLRADVGDVKNLLGDILGEFKKLSIKMAERTALSDELFGFPDTEDYEPDAAAYQQPLSSRNVIPPPPPQTVGYPPVFNPALPFYPGMVWGGGMPFNDEFRPMPPAPPVAAVPLPVVPVPAIDFSVNKQVPNVVVTSSVTLPSLTKPAPPLMGVTIPPEHVRHAAKTPEAHAFQITLPPGSAVTSPSVLQSPSDQYEARVYDVKLTPNQPIFKSQDASTNQTSPFKFGQLASPLLATPKSTLNLTPSRLNSSNDDDSVVDNDYDPRPDFKPIVNLAEVEVHTGEEHETQLFQSQAKLYVYRDNQWKERGRGVVKILHDEATDKVRLLMRRDQVHKICANHLIVAELALEPMKQAQNAYIWAANDFADEEVSLEKFCIKFANNDEARDFEYAFNRGKEISRDSPKKKTPEKPLEIGKTTPQAKARVTFAPTTVTPSSKDALMDETNAVFGSKSSIVDFTALAKGSNANAFKANPDFKGFAGAGAPIFGAAKPLNTSQDPQDDSVEEFEPTADFAPVIPLPELVTVRTGEEDETVLFEERAKILRFADGIAGGKEWKEKGVGNAKLLLNVETGKVRILMRRDQVLKVCLNHFIDENLKFERMKASSVASTWTAMDFAEADGKVEILCIKFGKAPTLDKFLETVADIQKQMTDGCMKTANGKAKTSVKTEPKPLSEMFKKPANTWECEACLIRNQDSVNECSCCQALRPGSQPATPAAAKPLSEMFKKASGSWECPGCMVRNDASVIRCQCCDTLQPGVKDDGPKPAATSNFSFGVPSTQSFSFGVPPAATAQTLGNNQKSAPAATTSVSSGFALGTSTTPAFSFGIPAAPTNATSGFSFGAQPVTAKSDGKSTFSFGNTTAGAATATTGFSFSPVVKPAAPALNGSALGENELKTGSSFNFSLKSEVASPDVKSDDDVEDLEKEDENITFKPVIPMPDKVELSTGEENEQVLYTHRCKLYRWADTEWKERGLGDIKILKNNDTGKVRFLMRREQVLKICLNHFLTEGFDLAPKDDRCWLWCAADFSEGVVSYDKFCARFKNKEVAEEFHRAVEEALANLVPSPEQARAAVERSPSAARTLFVDDEVQVLQMYESTAEQVAEARRLMLPDNWFRYEHSPKCSGCIGCEDTDRAGSTKTESKKFEVTPVIAEIRPPSSEKQSPSNKTDENKSPASDKSKSPPSDVTVVGKSPVSDNSTIENSPTAVNRNVIKSGLLPKPSETIFGKTAVTPPEVVEIKKPETPKSSLFTSFSFNSLATPAFGSSSGGIFGPKAGETGFGAKPVFGGLGTSTFGAKPTDGATVPSVFGSGASTFGTKPTESGTTPSVFGSTTSVFGAKPSNDTGNTPVFGSTNEGAKYENKPLFGSTPVFGNNTMTSSMFGPISSDAGKTPIFGSASGSIFGSGTNSGASVFGGSPVVGQNKGQSPAIFGTASGNIFVGAKLDSSIPAFTASPEFSFSSLAANSANQFEKKSTPGWSTEVKPIFGGKSPSKKDNEDDGSEEGEVDGEDAHDPQFQPIIDLPPVVEVKTGEEDEQVLFSERSKLYRFDTNTKEWKERGVGDIKILHNAQNGSYRVIHRREQVHKVVCNMRITADMELKRLSKDTKSWLWAGMNFADDEGETIEQLAVRFRLEERADEFKKVFDDCVIVLRDRSNVSNSGLHSTGVDDSEEVYEYHDGEDDEYDDEGSLVLTKSNVTLSYLKKKDFIEIADHLTLQVIEHSGVYSLVLEDEDGVKSNTQVELEQAYKVPPMSLMWLAQDFAAEGEAYRTLRVDLENSEDADHLYDTIMAIDLPDEVGQSLV